VKGKGLGSNNVSVHNNECLSTIMFLPNTSLSEGLNFHNDRMDEEVAFGLLH